MCTYSNSQHSYGPQRYELKCDPRHFADVQCGCKTVELRKDDRYFRVGDSVVLQEWTELDGYTGNQVVRRISHVLRNCEGLSYGWVALSLERL